MGAHNRHFVPKRNSKYLCSSYFRKNEKSQPRPADAQTTASWRDGEMDGRDSAQVIDHNVGRPRRAVLRPSETVSYRDAPAPSSSTVPLAESAAPAVS